MAVRTLTRLAAALAASVALSGGTSSAFFPPLPDRTQTVTTSPEPLPIRETTTVVPPTPPTPFKPPEPTHRPAEPIWCEPPPPCGVPEPATVVSGVLGLGAVAGVALRKKLRRAPGDASAT